MLRAADVRVAYVFGESAGGPTPSDGDLGLAVIFDDLDYSTRDETAAALREAVETACGYRNQELFVTDRYEWYVRTELLASTRQSLIRSAATLLFEDEPTGRVGWDKPIGLAATREAMIGEALRVANEDAIELEMRLSPCRWEIDAAGSGNVEEYEYRKRQRFIRICGHATRLAEHLLKAFVDCLRGSYPRTHSVAALLGSLPGTARPEISRTVRALFPDPRNQGERHPTMWEDLGSWHEASQQADGHPVLWDRADEAYTSDLLTRVLELADHIDSHLMKDQSVLGDLDCLTMARRVRTSVAAAQLTLQESGLADSTLERQARAARKQGRARNP